MSKKILSLILVISLFTSTAYAAKSVNDLKSELAHPAALLRQIVVHLRGRTQNRLVPIDAR